MNRPVNKHLRPKFFNSVSGRKKNELRRFRVLGSGIVEQERPGGINPSGLHCNPN